MRTQMWTRFAIVGLIVLTVLLAVPSGRVAGQIMGDLPTNWFFPPFVATAAQVVRLTYTNTLSVPVFATLEIFGGKVTGTTWAANLLATQINTILSPGLGTTLTVDWSLAGGLGAGERAQVFGRLHITPSGFSTTPGAVPTAALEVSDLLGVLVPQAVGHQADRGTKPGADSITMGFHTVPVIVTNRHVVRLSYVNTNGAQVRVNLAIIGSKMNGTSWNADTPLASQKDVVLTPGQGTVLTLNWNAAGGLGPTERAQVYARVSVNGVIDPKTDSVASLQITDLLGVLPGRSQAIEKDGTV